MENGKGKNLIRQAVEEVAKKRGVPVEEIKREFLEYDDKLRESGIPEGEQSANEHDALIDDKK